MADVNELAARWLVARNLTAAFSNDADWQATNDVAGARASGVLLIPEKFSSLTLALQLVALTGNAVESPFVGSVDVQPLDITNFGQGEQVARFAIPVTVTVGQVSILPATGKALLAFRMTAFTAIDVAVDRIVLLAKLI